MRLVAHKTTIGELKPGDLYVPKERDAYQNKEDGDCTIGYLVWIRHEAPPESDSDARRIAYRLEVVHE